MSDTPPTEQLTPLQNAVYLLKQAQAKVAAYEYARSEPIAVIGLANRFPGPAATPAAFWRLLADGVDAIREVPADRWDIDEYYDPDPTAQGKMNSRFGGFLDKIDEFDADFFGISPREAVRVDPQQRLLLEVAWEALEDAAVPVDGLAGTKAGVFVGVIGSDYGMLQSQNFDDMDIFSGTGVSHAILANRLSYVLNLTGPSMTLDTACSSSLVTVHLACQSLRRREADLALAAGVNLIIGPEMSLALTRAHMLAPDGRCKTFDAAANGYVRGEGCGVVVLKRLSDALAHGDRISAVIRGSAVNHDGRSNGLSAPNGPAQEAVIRAALASANLAPRDVGYVEAHGTGTRLGDPIEVGALQAVLSLGRPADRPLMLGSVKTNIGHLESAAGVAGLIKVILMLRHGTVPPHLHLKEPNPLLKLEESCMLIPTAARPWPRTDEPRRAGVSSFGFGGTNAHVLVEEPPLEAPRAPTAVDRPLHLLTLSARSAEALAELAGRYADGVSADPAAPLADLAYTANTGRARFAHRAAVVAASADELVERLRALRSGQEAPGLHVGTLPRERAPRVAFLFTGQGCQHAGMGSRLYETQPTFRAALDRCAEALRGELDVPLASLFAPESGALLERTGYLQPALFAFEYAMATLWRSFGLEPAAVLGHSVGELAAACVAGVFSLEDGLRLVAARARLMQALPAGGLMASVFASEPRVAAGLQPCADRVAIAGLNGPEATVISGDDGPVREALARFSAAGISSKVLATSHAFHSHRMDPVVDELSRVGATVACRPPAIECISNLTGQAADEGTYRDPAYWGRHARAPVRFVEGIRALAARGIEVFLEVGPAPTLVGLGQRCLPDGGQSWLPSLRPGHDPWQTLLTSLSQLFVRGADVDWAAFDRDYPRRKVALPTYPFQRKRYWLAEPSGARRPGSKAARPDAPPLLGSRVALATSECVFESALAARRPTLLAEHTLQGAVVMPGAGYMEMALAASAAAFGAPWILSDVAVQEPLLLDKAPTTVQTVLAPAGATSATFTIASVAPGAADGPPAVTVHASGRLERPADPAPEVFPVDLEGERARFTGEPFDAAWRREALRKSGLEPGPGFTWVLRHWLEGREALGEMRAEGDADHVDAYRVHPGLIDCALQLLGSTLPGAGTGIDAYVPMGLARLEVRTPPRGPTWCLATLVTLEPNRAVGNVRLVDGSGRLLISMEGIQLRRVPRDWLARLTAGSLPNWLCEQVYVHEAPSSAPNSSPPGGWLLFSAGDPISSSLSSGLLAAGHSCTVVPPGVTPDARAAAVATFLSSPDVPPRGVVLFVAPPGERQGEAPDFDAARRDGWGAALDVVHAVGATDSKNRTEAVRFFVVTRGAQAAGGRALPMSLAQAPAWGLGRVVAAEHPELACTRVDLDPDDRRSEAELLVHELLEAGREDEVAFRAGERLVARLRRQGSGGAGSGALELPRGQPYRLEITSRGQLDNVALRPAPRQAPGPGQVEVRVRATGLNFRDVLNVLNLYPGDPGQLGGECSGEVAAVGPGVGGFQVGDPVLALAPATFASYALTRAEFVARKPEHLSHEQAATLPVCFLTAHHALRHLAALRSGERVLVHAASGGVGLAAVQMAQRAGAEVWATAGNARKREFLKSLGVEHVYSSRSTDFAAQILEATGGAGVDVVLNSLTGETIGASLSLLRPGGRFLELGKTDLWDQARVDAARPGVTFHAIALDQMMAEQPEAVGRLMREVMAQVGERTLEPLPLRAFPMVGAVDALRFMARAEHLGKIVVVAADGESGERSFTPRAPGTYLVTGGLGGLGLTVARWLGDRGARDIVLVGRTGPSEEAEKKMDALRASGIRVTVRACDVARRDEVTSLLSDLARELPPLVGVFHLAGVLDDGVLRDQTRERFDRVMGAKALGAWHLHELTRDLPLEQFVLFSSAAALLGSPGQGNYAAANAFLDALAQHRRFEGRPALSVNWGSWAEVGMAARLKDTEGRRWAASGMDWIDPVRGIQTLEQLLVEGHVQRGVLPIDWRRFFERIPAGSEPGRFSELARQARASGAPDQSGPPALLEELRKVTPAERLDLALTHLRQQAARVLAMDPANLPDPTRMLNELGFDSLVGVEFCNRVGRSIGQRVSPTVLFDHPTLERLATHVVRDVLHLETAPETGGAKPADPAAEARLKTLAAVQELSDEEMNALVDSQLEKL